MSSARNMDLMHAAIAALNAEADEQNLLNGGVYQISHSGVIEASGDIRYTVSVQERELMRGSPYEVIRLIRKELIVSLEDILDLVANSMSALGAHVEVIHGTYPIKVIAGL